MMVFIHQPKNGFMTWCLYGGRHCVTFDYFLLYWYFLTIWEGINIHRNSERLRSLGAASALNISATGHQCFVYRMGRPRSWVGREVAVGLSLVRTWKGRYSSFKGNV